MSSRRSRGGFPRGEVMFDHFILWLGSAFMLTPVVAALMTASFTDVEIARSGLQFAWGDQFLTNFDRAMNDASGFTGTIDGWVMLKNSFILGIGFAVGKIVISMLAAYAIVYFRFRLAVPAFWVIFTT